MEKSFLNFINEDIMRTKKFSEMDNWSAQTNDTKKYTGVKYLDSEIGRNVYEMLLSHGLIATCGRGDYLERFDILIGDESEFVEYRVTLSKLVDEYDEMSAEEQRELDERYKNENIDDNSNYRMVFSTFLPLNVERLGDTEIVYLALSDASNYLKVLNKSFPDIMRGYQDRNVFIDSPDETTAFINEKKIRITNKNIPIVANISHRLYRDSKFFGEVGNEYDKSFLNTLVSDWLKLL